MHLIQVPCFSKLQPSKAGRAMQGLPGGGGILGDPELPRAGKSS